MKSPDAVLKEWVYAASAGDEASWKALYTNFYPAMYATAIGICRDTDLAADLVQDAFVTVYLKLSQLTDPAKFGAWLKQIVTHKCYRSIAKERQVVSLECLPSGWEQNWKDDTDKVGEELEQQRRLFPLLAALPGVLNSTILLRYFSGFQSYEEIAAILHIPIGTVRSRLNQAKKNLWDYWQKQPDIRFDNYCKSEEWNACYTEWYGGMHAHDSCKSVFVHHVHQANVVFPTGRQHAGSHIFEQMVHEDRQAGSWLQPFNIVSSGNISIIESRHFNSSKHPHHCPDRSVLVVFREGSRASRLFVHTDQQ